MVLETDKTIEYSLSVSQILKMKNTSSCYKYPFASDNYLPPIVFGNQAIKWNGLRIVYHPYDYQNAVLYHKTMYWLGCMK